MDFFGIGTGELAVILLLAVLVLGPQRMVVSARQLGRAIRKAREFLARLDAETPEELREISAVVNEVRTAGADLRTQITRKLTEAPTPANPLSIPDSHSIAPPGAPTSLPARPPFLPPEADDAGVPGHPLAEDAAPAIASPAVSGVSGTTPQVVPPPEPEAGP